MCVLENTYTKEHNKYLDWNVQKWDVHSMRINCRSQKSFSPWSLQVSFHFRFPTSSNNSVSSNTTLTRRCDRKIVLVYFDFPQTSKWRGNGYIWRYVKDDNKNAFHKCNARKLHFLIMHLWRSAKHVINKSKRCMSRSASLMISA